MYPVVLTLNVPSKMCIRQHSKNLHVFFFQRKYVLKFYVKQTIHMKCQYLFSIKSKRKKYKSCLQQLWFAHLGLRSESHLEEMYVSASAPSENASTVWRNLRSLAVQKILNDDWLVCVDMCVVMYIFTCCNANMQVVYHQSRHCRLKTNSMSSNVSRHVLSMIR